MASTPISTVLGDVAWPHLKTLSWNLTSRCNFRCVHCYVGAGTKQSGTEFTKDSVFALVEEAAALGVETLFLAGGEPTLLEELPDYVAYVRQCGMIPYICSNLSLMTRELSFKLREAGLAGVSVGVDHLDPERFAHFRMKGRLDHVLRGIEICRADGLVVNIDFTLNRLNSGLVGEFHKFAIDVGASQLSMKRFVPEGRGHVNWDALSLPKEDYRSCLVQWAEECHSHQNEIYSFTHDPMYLVVLFELGLLDEVAVSRFGCRAAAIGSEGWLGVSPNGDVHPCPLMRSVTMGNVFANSLRSALYSPVCKSIAAELPGKCRSCECSEFCRGGCRATATRAGTPDEPDPMCWR
jgi:radical SAM protein with 4Fe4S-binding SPASM domain